MLRSFYTFLFVFQFLFLASGAWGSECQRALTSDREFIETIISEGQQKRYKNNISGELDELIQVKSEPEKVELYFKQKINGVDFIDEDATNYLEIKSYDNSDPQLAEHIEVSDTFIGDEYRRQGLNLLLHAYMLKMYPQATSVSAILIHVNQAAFIEEYIETGNEYAALRNTPFYKTLSQFGFTEIEFDSLYLPHDNAGVSTGRIVVIEVTLSKP